MVLLGDEEGVSMTVTGGGEMVTVTCKCPKDVKTDRMQNRSTHLGNDCLRYLQINIKKCHSLLTGGEAEVLAAAALELLAPCVPEAGEPRAMYSNRLSPAFPHVSKGYPGHGSAQSPELVDTPGAKFVHQHC